MKITITYVMCFMICFCAVSARADEIIKLPDVTTVVTGGGATAGKDALPDFGDVLPDRSSAPVVLPELPLPADSLPVSSAQTESASAGHKDLYASGAVGGGAPGSFLGNFSLYRSGSDPFHIDFSHESEDGYGSHSAADGFFTRVTAVRAEKTVSGPDHAASVAMSYDRVNEGLQNRSASFFDITRNTIDLSGNSDWHFPDGVTLSAGSTASWYSRYAGVSDTAVPVTTAEKDTAVAAFNPSVSAVWQKDSVSASLSGTYAFQGNFGSDDAFVAAAHSVSAQSTHRGEGTAKVAFKTDSAGVFADISVVCGTAIGDPVVIVPFTLGGSFSVPSFVAHRSALVELSAGLDSFQPQYSLLESSWHFTSLNMLPAETTDWFGTVKTSIPVQTSLIVTGEASYRSTAWGNGVWEPVFSQIIDSSGLYGYEQNSRTVITTQAGASLAIGIVSLDAAWNGYWITVPAACDPQNITFTVALQNAGSLWTAEGSFRVGAGNGVDFVPDVSGAAGYQINQSMRLVFELHDIVKLVTNSTRTYGDTNYAVRSGYALLLVKFQF
jgi:hypothetical protein